MSENSSAEPAARRGTLVGTRILVVGCPGAGKSTLAREIAAITRLPVIHLGQYYWRPGWREPDRDAWRREVAELIARPRWVIDGNYGGTLEFRLAAADTVVLLDFPTWLCFARVLIRQARSRGLTRDDMAPGCPERFDLKFLTYVCSYRRRHRPRHMAAIEQFSGNVITLHRPAETAAFVLDLSRRGGDLRRSAG